MKRSEEWGETQDWRRRRAVGRKAPQMVPRYGAKGHVVPVTIIMENINDSEKNYTRSRFETHSSSALSKNLETSRQRPTL